MADGNPDPHSLLHDTLWWNDQYIKKIRSQLPRDVADRVRLSSRLEDNKSIAVIMFHRFGVVLPSYEVRFNHAPVAHPDPDDPCWWAVLRDRDIALLCLCW